MISNTFIKNKNTITSIFLCSIFIFNLRNNLFPANFQQDDIAELEPIFFDRLICAFEWGDQHPLFSAIIWISSQIFEWPEYFISLLIVLFAIFSIILFFNVLENLFNFNLALLGSVILITSPIFNTYTIGLKQYNFEIFATILSLWFLQNYKDYEINSKYFFYFLISYLLLFLLSFAAAIPIAISILFLIKSNKRLMYVPLFLFVASLPLQDNLFNKLSRVSNGGYWDEFFISTGSFNNFFESFYFLNQLFLKSIFPAFSHPLLTFTIFLSIFSVVFKKNELIMYSFVGLVSLYLLSILQFYPLGGGRTDLLFMPFVIVLFLNFIDIFINKIFPTKYLNFVSFLAIGYLVFILASTNVFYKNEDVTSALTNIQNFYNNEEVAIIVTEEQSHSLLYYSAKYYELGRLPSENCSMKFNIDNLYVQKDNETMTEIKEIKNHSEIYLLGIELPNTLGQIRIITQQLTQEGFILIEEQTFPGYIKLFYFNKR